MPVKKDNFRPTIRHIREKKIRGCKFSKSGSKIVAKGFPFTEITEEKVSDKVTNEKRRAADCKNLTAGIDIGSTTTKVTVVDPCDGRILYSDYRRHQADQVQSVIYVLEQLKNQFPHTLFRVGMTGSGAKPIAEQLGVPFIQEVAANAEALKSQYENIGTAIELGGQDAKMIFFREGENTGALNVADMRMNGSCAGGTGAFIDEIASVLKVPVEEFNSLAAEGKCVYDISGRCGVYAKTDIQPLLNQGISKADLALSAFHAIAKQTIGGLAQGLDIEPPVAFEGGPLTSICLRDMKNGKAVSEYCRIFPSGNLPENVVYINLVLFCVLQRTVF